MPSTAADLPHRSLRMPPTDRVVVRAAMEAEGARGREARATLYASYYPHVLGSLRRKGIDDRRAEEATQDFFARLFDPKDHLGRSFSAVRLGAGSFGGWLRLVSWRALLNRLREDRRDASARSLDCDEVAGLEAPLPVHEPLDDECAKVLIVRRAYERLRSEFSSVHEVGFVDVLYAYLSGETESLASEHFARAFALTELAVRKRRQRMIEKLRRYLVDEANELYSDSQHIEDELRRLALLE